MTNKILHWLPDTDLRNGHAGLAELAKKKLKVDVDDLKVGEFVMFMNSHFTAFKIYCSHRVLLHYKEKDGARLNAKAILSLPHFISGQHINYDKALAAVITKEYGSRYKDG